VLPNQERIDNYIPLPIGDPKSFDRANKPLNQIGFRLTQHPYAQFAISANENALFQEYDALERKRMKEQKIEMFHTQACQRVHERTMNKQEEDLKLDKRIAFNIKKVLLTAIELSKAQSRALHFCSKGSPTLETKTESSRSKVLLTK
jgi:hypothetical protein